MVKKNNGYTTYAVRMYEKAGFKTMDENEEEYIMVCEL
jgi:ribosomal protein S18 acetylase RimI-like enzyme